MTSLLEQYQISKIQKPQTSSNIISALLADECPIFLRHRINFKPKCDILCAAVSDKYVILGLQAVIVLRIDLSCPEKFEEIDLNKQSLSFTTQNNGIYAIYIDPTSSHTIVSLNSGDVLYLTKNAKKCKVLPKIKNVIISCIAWNKWNTSKTQTGHILLGTTKGIIIETNLLQIEDRPLFNASPELYTKMINNLTRERECHIVGIEFQKISPSNQVSSGPGTEEKYFVIVTTTNRLYQYIHSLAENPEGPTLFRIFSRYDHQPEKFHELPGHLSHSQLAFCYRETDLYPITFAWLSGSGIFLGTIDTTFRTKEDSVIAETRLLPYPKAKDRPELSQPLGIVLTQFHALALYPTTLQAINTLNDEVVYEDTLPDNYGRMIGIAKDITKPGANVWVFAERAVFRYKITRENRDIWKIYLDRENFDLAKNYCQDDIVSLDKVRIAEAEHSFALGDFERAAKCFAASEAPLQEVALKFACEERSFKRIASNDTQNGSNGKRNNKRQHLTHDIKVSSALTHYLTEILEHKVSSQEKTQITLLVVWITELYLTRMAKIKNNHEIYVKMLQEFKKFLELPKIQESLYLNQNIISKLISSHMNDDAYLFFAHHSKDYDKLIQYYIQKEDFTTALQILSKQRDTELYYKFSPLLADHIPRALVDSWLTQSSRGPSLDPSGLIPTLVKLAGVEPDQAIRYLEYCTQIEGISNVAVHNFLLGLYCQHQPDQLVKYLQMQGQDKTLVKYDLNYALRLCLDYNNLRAGVLLYTVAEQHEQAVLLCLKFDVQLAKQTANACQEDENLKKRLWLLIAKHLLRSENDVKSAIELCKECEVLKIEDILPYFPNFDTIDHFKETIMTSLQDYNSHLFSLKEEMEDSTKSATSLRDEISNYRNDFLIVKSSDVCSYCRSSIMKRPFHLFPCSHFFHSDCLLREVKTLLPEAEKNKLVEAERLLKSTNNLLLDTRKDYKLASARSLEKEGENGEETYHKAKAFFDSNVGNECPYCGELMINSVDKPFIDVDRYEEEFKSWL